MTLPRGTSSLDNSTGSTYTKKMKRNQDDYMSFCLRSVLCNLLGQFLKKIKVEDMKINGIKYKLSFSWRKRRKNITL